MILRNYLPNTSMSYTGEYDGRRQGGKDSNFVIYVLDDIIYALICWSISGQN